MKGRMPMKKGLLKRLLKILFKEYKALLVIMATCLVISAVAGSVTGLFLNNVYSTLEDAMIKNDSGAVIGLSGVDIAWRKIVITLIILACIYLIGIVCNFIMQRTGAVLTQTFLKDMRVKCFTKMQRLPIKYFDRKNHGDIMSTYTNDIDALRQLISQSLPQVCSTIITLIALSCIMMYLSIMLFLAVLVGVFSILLVTKFIGGKSAKFFMAQQQAVGKMEGYVEEMMHGQKVVKVFCHEQEAINKMHEINGHLFNVSNKANAFSNMLMPIIHNIGNIMYVVIAFIGGSIYIFSQGSGINISLASLFNNGTFIEVLQINIIVSFLGMARQFANMIGQISNQINSVIMAMAGANRIFDLLDQPEEEDKGYVTLVHAHVDENGNITESKERTGVWAWKHPHGDGTITYTLLKGDIVMDDVDFGYDEDKIVLHNISLYAKPGQKIAFVGATGAGKTTITNLINRFYDIADGKIRYDGININKIKKSDLRRSLGIVLQDTNLFTGTVMDNIRYGKLDATDEECIEAAKLANAHDFITRLPDGYNTMLVSDGANLSQGQRQLLSIARAEVADAPVMILDEATSSIDTRTEALVSRGMDSLMRGRTVFVIAHRLSTVQNSDVIMMLDHGRIIERGTHNDLIEKKGEYYKLYTGALELE
ncbi:MAG: ABC transporter ATP-binding protein [Clostridiales bacterium]|nr:ABC transporter ATP-binding protein [Clostridiales bacterium]